MARQRTPLNVLDLTGRLAHDKKRFADRTPPPVDDAPIGLEPEMRLISFAEAWAAVLDICPTGVLRKRDRLIVQETARLYREIHNAQVLADLGGEMYTQVPAAISKLYQSYLAKLGCSPVDANHVSTGKTAPAGNPFDDD